LDGQRFDMFAKAMSKGVSRRAVWRGAIGAATGLLALDTRKTHAQEVFGLGTPVVCPPGTFDCGGQCVDLMTDDDNCGSCGESCDGLGDIGLGYGQICVGGNCQCPAGQEICGDEFPSCTDTSSHPIHCGTCFNPCAEGESCVEGVCTTTGGVEETPTVDPEDPSPVAQPTAEQGVSGLPSTGAGPQQDGLVDTRIPLLGAGAAIGATVIARLTRRVPKAEEDRTFETRYCGRSIQLVC
jgi:hypothetical protein